MDVLTVRLDSVQYAARDINLYCFCSADGGSLPRASAGAHIDLYIPDLGVRQYSLVTSGNDDAYVIAVKREENGKGGSLFLHDKARVGSIFKIGVPRNNFPLNENAAHSVFFAGGIGITPIVSMVRRLQKIGNSWELHFACRSPQDAAFVKELEHHPQVRFHFDCENEGRPIDLAIAVSAAPPESEFYCCGPLPMLDAFELATADRPAEQRHVEYFSPKQEAASGGFSIRIRSTGDVLAVPPGKSILDVLLDAGLTVPYSCADGICGACETAVVEGIPDHRDSVLTDAEKALGRSVMVCCSGSLTEFLTLDL